MSVCFVFQAEDGIRDLVRSRGLGDVYKRQLVNVVAGFDYKVSDRLVLGLMGTYESSDLDGSGAVSYTHLTLPTSDLV